MLDRSKWVFFVLKKDNLMLLMMVHLLMIMIEEDEDVRMRMSWFMILFSTCNDWINMSFSVTVPRIKRHNWMDGLSTWLTHKKWAFNRSRVVLGFVYKNRGTPKWMGKIRENPIKMDDLGVPLFLETPIYVNIQYTMGTHNPCGFSPPLSIDPTFMTPHERAK